jgi:hypothetical protein
MEMSAHLTACEIEEFRLSTRSMIGLPYFDSPIWK